MRMKETHINITTVQCYVPTNDIEKENKDAFYDQLQAELEGSPRDVKMIVMGDDTAMRKEGCSSMKNNVDTPLEFCTATIYHIKKSTRGWC